VPTDTRHTRTVILVTGLVVVVGVALVMLARGTDPVEVVAILFFAPVLVGLLYLGPAGGTLLAVAAAAGYVGLRWPAIQLVGWEPVVGRIATRAVGYLLFGLAGGWATRTLLADLDRLSTAGDVDPTTGLHTARAFARLAVSERERVDRYGGEFTVAVVPVSGLPERRARRRRTLHELGQAVRSSLRKTDHLALVAAGGRPALAVILTGTDTVGAGPAIGHLERAAAGLGLETGTVDVAAYPSDPEGVRSIVDAITSGVTTTSPT